MTRLAGIDIDAPPALVLPLFVVVLLGASALAARTASRLVARWLTARLPGGSGHEPPSLTIPVGGAVLIGGLLLVVPELDVPGKLGRWLNDGLDVLFVLACTMGISRLAVAAVTVYAARNPSVSPALGVARVAVRLLVGILGAITALQTLGVPVAPLLTTLGVGSLAVALALQETLANFFAGLYLLADRPVRTGDYIKIHDGEEGYVEAIGWRSSRLRTQRNNVVIVPNQKLSQAILTNFHLPSPPVTLTVPVAVSYDADPAIVEKALGDEASRAAGEIPEIKGAQDYGAGTIAVRLVDLGDSGMVFHCTVDVRDVEAQARAGHELRKRILARLRREGIEVAYPQRVIHTAADDTDDDAAPLTASGSRSDR
jgi:small-conductance mechanosensitive channel